ncbi:MAG: hypothetical protein UR28_C0039G0020 [Candidatus Peregrinibacteria bacterium GW2011_GWF2_33_10]|nr:MAG: hypothetical protein UR28_C0039G0020 [Candidatus Peregrinibacteria bacterium GW2011_GWF2_33_10]
MLEGEGGLTPGVVHETKNSAYGLGLGNLIALIDWNDYGIDDRKFSDVVYGTPQEWFSHHGWKAYGTENGSDFESIMKAYEKLFENDDKLTPKALWVKTRKGRGYGKFDNASHGSAHARNSKEFWITKREFAEKYDLKFECMDACECCYVDNKDEMKSALETVMSVFDKNPDFLDYLADRLIEMAEMVPEDLDKNKIFDKNPLKDKALYDYKNYPVYLKPGTKVTNSKGMGAFGSWINTYCQQKYGRPLFFAASADLAGSTNVIGFSHGHNGAENFGMYNRVTNKKGTLLPQAITEFANAGIMVGISSVNLDKKPFEQFNGFYSISSTYGAFSYLKYGIMRIFSQTVQDSNIKLGKTIWVSGHSGPETAEDSRTHFGIFSPGVTQLFPKGHVINLHPWEYNEVPVVLGAALATEKHIIVLHLTRPAIEIPDRESLGVVSHFESAKGAYIIKDYDKNREKEGIVIVRGTKPTANIIELLPKIRKEGPNVKIIAAISSELFEMQTKEYQDSVISKNEWLNAMIITNTGIDLMNHWMKHSIVKEYSLSPDWDDRWRTGGTLDQVMEESHLSKDWIWKAITKFAEDKALRIKKIKEGMFE